MQEPKKYYEIYAVDFDGTLTEKSCWPWIGEPNRPFIEWLIRERERGVKLILWTNRVGELLDDAVAWCRMRGLEFDAVNDNIPEMKEAFGNNSRKVFASKYFDDRNSWWIDVDSGEGPLTMDEAIAHCYDVAEKKKDCEECCMMHLMLARWLEELKDRRKAEAVQKAIDSGLAPVGAGEGAMKSDELICTRHEEIMNICREQFEDLPPEAKAPQEYSGVYEAFRKILGEAGKALEDGQNMENRLTEYYTAIKNLGFERRKAGEA